MADKSCMKLTCKVRVYEMLGSEAYLHTEYSGSGLTARVKADTKAREGHTVVFGLDMHKIHVIDAETDGTISN